MQISGRETSECIKVFKDINDLKDSITTTALRYDNAISTSICAVKIRRNIVSG